jgi:hypothetical protein
MPRAYVYVQNLAADAEAILALMNARCMVSHAGVNVNLVCLWSRPTSATEALGANISFHAMRYHRGKAGE